MTLSLTESVVVEENPRFGYGVAFLDRQLVLRALADSVAQKDKMLLNKIVRNIDHTDSGVTVNCEDGMSYHGDIVVGCDGVNSKASIRREMYRFAYKEDPEHFPEIEKTSMHRSRRPKNHD